MLEELSKHDEKWRRLAFGMVQDKDLADELVQEMYIKIHNLNKEQVNDAYVYYTMKHILFNRLKAKREFVTELEFEIIISDSKCNSSWITTTDNDNTLELRQEINECLELMDFSDREILLHTHERSFMKNQDLLNLSASSLWHWRNEAIEKLKKIYYERNVQKP